MTKRYKHTQVGYVTIISLGIGLLLAVFLMAVYAPNWVSFACLIILGLCVALFATLTTVIDKDFLEIRFGPGFIRKKFPLKDIESCKTVKNPWYYGWGIHLTDQGWLFNVSGLHAVEINMKNGKKYRIGTDEPAALEKAVRESTI